MPPMAGLGLSYLMGWGHGLLGESYRISNFFWRTRRETHRYRSHRVFDGRGAPRTPLGLVKSIVRRISSATRWGRRGNETRQAGVLSPNDVRREEGWPASNDPTADSIEPPISGGKPADASADDPPAPAPPDDKIAPFNPRARHGGD